MKLMATPLTRRVGGQVLFSSDLLNKSFLQGSSVSWLNLDISPKVSFGCTFWGGTEVIVGVLSSGLLKKCQQEQGIMEYVGLWTVYF